MAGSREHPELVQDFRADRSAGPLLRELEEGQASGDGFFWTGDRLGSHGTGSIGDLFASGVWLFTGDSPTEEISAASAIQILTSCLETDIAYGVRRRDSVIATRLAGDFVSLVDGPNARWWTNVCQMREGTGVGSWRPMTDATFDAGVVGVAGPRLAVAWVADAD